MSFAYVAEFSSFGADIDLTTVPPAAAGAAGVTRFEVLDVGSGGLALRLAGSGVNVALTGVTAGDVALNPSRILSSGTSVAKVRVWWGRRRT